MAQIPLVKARLLGVVLECIAYGIFTALFAQAMYFLSTRTQRTTFMLKVTMISMFLLATGHISAILSAAFDAFCDENQDPRSFYRKVSDPREVAQGFLLESLIVIGDLFMIYRSYIIWGRKWYIAIFPIFAVIANAVAGYGAAAALLSTVPGDPISAAFVKPWMTSAGVLSVVINIVCTGLIGYRLWSIQHGLPSPQLSSGGSSYSAFIIVVESAAIYSASQIIFLIAYLVESNGQYAILDIIPCIIGINFSVIIIRISFGLTNFAGLANETSANSREVRTIGGSRRVVGNEIELGSRTPQVAVHVDKFVEVSRTDSKTNIL